MENISKHITYKEATRSETAKRLGIENTPDEIQLFNMQQLAEKVFEPLRNHFNVPIFIWSFFRSPEVNKKTKGAATNSQHSKGQAIDIDAQIYGGTTNKEIFDYILNNLIFDQLVFEFGNDDEPDWIHVSYNCINNRNKVLRAIKGEDGKTKYIEYEKNS